MSGTTRPGMMAIAAVSYARAAATARAESTLLLRLLELPLASPLSLILLSMTSLAVTVAVAASAIMSVRTQYARFAGPLNGWEREIGKHSDKRGSPVSGEDARNGRCGLRVCL